MEISKFFNSAPGDKRTHQASDFASYFGDVLSTGLLHTNKVPALRVRCEGNDLRTYVEAGKAIMEGYAYQNTSNLYLDHALPEPTLDRIDRIVLRLDKRNQSRLIRLFVKQGEANANPQPPVLQRDDFIYELSLARIRVRANTSTLNPNDLVDERLNENVCGLVSSLISIPTSQFQEQWDEFIKDIQDEGFATKVEFDAHEAHGTMHVPYVVDSGTANAKVVTLNPAPTSYVDGMALTFKNNVQNTGAVTINVNGLGAKSILKSNGNALSSGNLKTGIPYTLRYNGTAFILQGEGGEYGNALASHVLAPNTFGTENGVVQGTMPNRGAFNLALGATVPAGYYSGGSVPSGKRWASGTITSSGVNDYFYGVQSGSFARPFITVSGLTFEPSFIHAVINQGQATTETTTYSKYLNEFYARSIKMAVSYGGGQTTSAHTFHIKGDAGAAYVNATGFRIPVALTYTSVQWIAFE